MKKLNIIIAAFSLILAISLQAETPQQASQVILKLVKENNYDELFRTRFCELHKAKDAEETREVIEVLSGYWKEDQSKIINTFEQLTTAEFVISEHKYAQKTETGKKATAPVNLDGKEGKYVLYELKTGLWGFHM